MTTGRKYYRDGNKDVYHYFNEGRFKNLSKSDRARWTPAGDDERAIIPKEVIDFMEEEGIPAKPDPCCKENTPDPCCKESIEDDPKAILKAQLDDLGIRYSHNAGIKRLSEQLEDATNPK